MRNSDTCISGKKHVTVQATVQFPLPPSLPASPLYLYRGYSICHCNVSPPQCLVVCNSISTGAVPSCICVSLYVCFNLTIRIVWLCTVLLIQILWAVLQESVNVCSTFQKYCLSITWSLSVHLPNFKIKIVTWSSTGPYWTDVSVKWSLAEAC